MADMTVSFHLRSPCDLVEVWQELPKIEAIIGCSYLLELHKIKHFFRYTFL
jgi:hypothetical protein